MQTLWNDLTQHQLFITGGVGSAHTIEGFTFPYDLPNETAYSETCASIALVYWAQRMFYLAPHSRYVDVMERALYNAMLSGVSYEGSLFFQANPLTSYPNVSPYERWNNIMTGTHYQRTEWFDVACCPSNLARLVASVGGYFYSATPKRLYIHLYNQNRTQTVFNGSMVQIEQQTGYPWGSDVYLALTMAQPTRFELALRIPGWCRDFRLELNGAELTREPEHGYAIIEREWQTGDTVTLSFTMPIERTISHPHIRDNAGRVALQRGPIIYCLEEVDNGTALASVSLPHDAQLTYALDGNLFGGVGTIKGDALRIEPTRWGSEPYQRESFQEVAQTPFTMKAIPYCFWANRQPGEMRVWLLKA